MDKLKEKKQEMIITVIVAISIAGISNIIYKLFNTTDVKFLRQTEYGFIFHELIGLIIIYAVLEYVFYALSFQKTE